MLEKAKRVEGQIDTFDPVFRLENGDLITEHFINELMEGILRPLFPDINGTWSCHSFRGGVPAMMATAPTKFNRLETMASGAWDSNCVDKYTRLTGITNMVINEKFQDFLRYIYCCNIYIILCFIFVL